MKNHIFILALFFNFGCIVDQGLKPEPSYVPEAELNYRKYFDTNQNSLDPIEGVWTEYVVGTLYEDGKVIQRKEISKRARWIVFKKGSIYNIINEYGEQNQFVASFKPSRDANTFTFVFAISSNQKTTSLQKQSWSMAKGSKWPMMRRRVCLRNTTMILWMKH